MVYTLEQLTKDLRDTLEAMDLPAGGDALCAHVERALSDEEFLRDNFGPDKTEKRTIVYEDPELGFCVCVHVYEGAAKTGPHDHGGHWAIYGQAVGSTDMTDWRIVSPVDGDKPARAEPVKTYKMTPGMGHFYAADAVHSPSRDNSTKLLRIEGANLDHVTRMPIEPAQTETV